MTQQARNLVMQLGDQHSFRFLIHDRDTKVAHAFDEIFRTQGISLIKTPIQAPNANAHAERWVRTLPRVPGPPVATVPTPESAWISCRRARSMTWPYSGLTLGSLGENLAGACNAREA
jgi:hypothetical protein